MALEKAFFKTCQLLIIAIVFNISAYWFCNLIDKKRAIVARPRGCTLCRECIREDEFKQDVALRRVKDHFICK